MPRIWGPIREPPPSAEPSLPESLGVQFLYQDSLSLGPFMLSRKFGSVRLAACAILLPMLSRADSQVRIVRLSYVDGDVQIDRRDGRGFERAILNMPVTSGVRLRTGDDARAEVEFEKGS